MRLSVKGALVSSFILGLLVLCDSRAGFRPPPPEVLPPVTGPALETNVFPPCQFPELADASTDQTAWRVFVAATCPIKSGKRTQVAWEDWPAPAHPSEPVSKLIRVNGSPPVVEDRRPLDGSTFAGSSPPWRCERKPSGRMICEELRRNPAMVDWLGRAEAAGRVVGELVPVAARDFGSPLIEVRAHWIRLPTCMNQTQAAHIEQRGTTCYELGGMQIVAELFDRWISASFEAQDLPSNPERCRMMRCSDGWGSSPAVSHGGAGGNTRLSPALSSLMQQANLTSEWLNYRLDEASSNAVDGMGNVIAPDTNRADGASLAVAAVGAQDVFGLSGGGLTPGPVPIADDTFDQRSSLSAMGTGCPWEGLGRSCVVAVVGRKGKTKRRT